MPYFPNSLELERRLRALGSMKELLEEPFQQLERFKLRFRDEYYMLMEESQIEKDALAETLAHATGTKPTALQFLSKQACKEMPREGQFAIYEQARTSSIRRLLESKDHKRFSAAKAKDEDREDSRRMIDVIKGAIGTRRLTLALDNTFGNSLASVFKHDIVAVWTSHFMAHVPKLRAVEGRAAVPFYDQERIKWTGKLVEYLTQVLPAIRLREPPENWIIFTA